MADPPRAPAHLLSKEEIDAALEAEARKGSGELPAVVVEALQEALPPDARETAMRCPACAGCTLCHGETMVPVHMAAEWRARNASTRRR